MPEDIESAVWELLAELSIAHTHLRPLLEQLENDFDADEGGYRQLRRILDEELRAVTSDQICQSARAIRENLIEARLHQRQLEELVGPEGVKYPDRTTHQDTILRGAQMDMAVTGCVRALGSAMDCLAATAIGILRMPFSIHAASFNGHLAKELTPKQTAASTPRQLEAWTGIKAVVDAHRQLPPDGWLDWLNGMRNLNVHRARQVHMLLQRLRESDQPQMSVSAADPIEVTKRTARFDLHLRGRPGLPDMQDFIASPMPSDLWINERATITVPGIVLLVNEMIEEAAQLLLAWWRYASKWPTKFPPPERWKLDQPPWSSFDGIAPSTTPFPVDVGVVGPHMTERLRLAERLRRAREPMAT